MFPLGFKMGLLLQMLPNTVVSLGLLAEIQKWYSVDANQDNVERLRF